MADPDRRPTPETSLEHLVYETPWWDFYYDETVRSDGSRGRYAWVKTHAGHGAIMTVPVTPSERYLLIKVYRYPVKRYLWEFPAGLIEAGESPVEAACRELIEETGIVPDSVELLGSQTPVAGLVGDEFYTVLTRLPEIELRDVTLQAEEGIVEAALVTRREIATMAAGQGIEDGVTLYSLARYWALQETQANGEAG